MSCGWQAQRILSLWSHLEYRFVRGDISTLNMNSSFTPIPSKVQDLMFGTIDTRGEQTIDQLKPSPLTGSGKFNGHIVIPDCLHVTCQTGSMLRAKQLTDWTITLVSLGN